MSQTKARCLMEGSMKARVQESYEVLLFFVPTDRLLDMSLPMDGKFFPIRCLSYVW